MDASIIDVDMIDKLQILLFVEDNCSFSNFAKEFCIKNLTNSVKIISINDPGGRIIYETICRSCKYAVPVFFSVKTGKLHVGICEVNTIVENLK